MTPPRCGGKRHYPLVRRAPSTLSSADGGSAWTWRRSDNPARLHTWDKMDARYASGSMDTPAQSGQRRIWVDGAHNLRAVPHLRTASGTQQVQRRWDHAGEEGCLLRAQDMDWAGNRASCLSAPGHTLSSLPSSSQTGEGQTTGPRLASFDAGRPSRRARGGARHGRCSLRDLVGDRVVCQSSHSERSIQRKPEKSGEGKLR
ncbi:hypothetical protein B0H14DRAFT_2927130 [Mycena olivaceomarginata]|nr:hypothetical protein B0H14DRAFT_2927130 [Mycena olivaceomarginata]